MTLQKKMLWVVNCVVVCLATNFLTINEVSGQVREIRRRLMSDIGYARVDRRGNPIVVINSRMCAQMGPELCNYFRAHEQAHHRLNHFGRNITVRQAEAEADSLAARMVSPQSRAAAARYFASGRGGSRMHGTPQARLARVSAAGNSANYRTVSRPRARPQVRYSAGVTRPSSNVR